MVIVMTHDTKSIQAKKCDEVDKCDENIDENVQNTYYADTDNDGFGDADNALMACDHLKDMSKI